MLDFGELWQRESQFRRPPGDAGEWDARARGDVSKFGPSEYSTAFLELAQLKEGESVFDMGCGAGSLAIPCARQGHEVLAADFSPVMLQRCREGVLEECAHLVRTKLLAWDDDWAAAGLKPRSYDVAFASRSIATADLAGAIRKLSAVARRKVCVTVVAGSSPRVSQPMFRDLGITCSGHWDAAYVFAIAMQQGFEPQVRWLKSLRTDRFASFEDAAAAYTGMLQFADAAASGEPLAVTPDDVLAWLRAHTRQEDDGRWAVTEEREFTWPFISWDV